jgi:aspartyl/asparaginyl beta-hydroxylase (cupin superfamily)
MFIDKRQFGFVEQLEACWTTIRDECLAVSADAFEPWVQREMYGEGWSVFGLVAFGQRIETGLRACPRTAELIAAVPGLTTAGFSRMAPGTHIEPHVGWVRTVYRLHLGLVVPTDCGLRVGADVRAWREGESVIFDDTCEHEAWNRSTKPRIVLLLDFLRPGVTNVKPDVPPDAVGEMIRRRVRESS